MEVYKFIEEIDMKRKKTINAALVNLRKIFLLTLLGSIGFVAVADEQPNIVIIMADDIGFSDFGCYGSEIKTPNIDQLGENGMRFSQFYNMSKCNPTRSSLLSGLYLPRQNAENAIPFSESLKNAGYATAMSGKQHYDSWIPEKFKFENSFENSFYFQTQISYFARPESGNYERSFKLNGKALKTSEIQAEIKPLYKTDFITDYALKFLDKIQAEKKPFLLYLPYHTAHYPLQARPEDIAKYRGTYMIGWDKIRKQRMERLKQIGLIAENTEISLPEESPFPIIGLGQYKPWDKLSNTEKDAMDLEMAVFAAMIDRLDQNVGRIIEKLEQINAIENTIILFFVDNGSCPFQRGELNGPPPGGADSFVCLSPAWANVGNTPFRYYKRYGYEGGTRSPFIAYWPKNIKPGINHSPAHLVDIYPTLLQLANTKYPSRIDNKTTPVLDGSSLLPLFKGKKRKESSIIISGFGDSNRSVRKGNWKLVHLPKSKWALYDLSFDPTEKNDLSGKYPDKTKELIKLWNDWKSTKLNNN